MTTEEAFSQQLEAICAEFQSQLPGKLARLEALWRDLVSGASDPVHFAEVHRELHSLAGSAKTFGVAGVSEAAAAAESFLEPFCERGALPGHADRIEFERLLERLRRSAPSR